jgi:serine protease Do
VKNSLKALLATLALLAPAATPALAQAAVPSAATIETLQGVYSRARSATIRVETDSGVGSGFFISSDGLLLTATHVVRDAKAIKVRSSDGRRYVATVVGYDELRDLAMLKAQGGKNFPTLALETAALKVGDSVLAIGNSREQFIAPRAGSVTALGTSIDPTFPTGLIQSTMPLAPGDSGGPILNAKGRVVGVAVAIGSDGWGYSSYAAPVSANASVIKELRSGVRNGVPVIGVSLAPLSPSVAGQLGLTSLEGVVVADVTAGSGAAKAGLRAPKTSTVTDEYGRNSTQVRSADVITAVDGRRVSSAEEIVTYLRTKTVGSAVSLTLLRDGKSLTVQVKLGARAVI